MTEKQIDNLRDLLSICHGMLERVEADYFLGEPWKVARDGLLKEIEKALDETAEEYPY